MSKHPTNNPEIFLLDPVYDLLLLLTFMQLPREKLFSSVIESLFSNFSDLT